MVGYVGVVVTVGWLVIMIGDLGRECGGRDDEEGGSFPGYGWYGCGGGLRRCLRETRVRVRVGHVRNRKFLTLPPFL